MDEKKRARLTADYVDPDQGFEYTKGQTGYYYNYPQIAAGFVFFHFDGYEDGKAKNEKLRREKGEGYNVVPWLAEIPVSILETIK